MKITRKFITNLVLALAAAGVFLIIGMRTDWSGTWNSVKNASPGWLAGGAGFMLASHLLRALRWSMLTEPAGYKLNTRRSFYAVMSGYLVNVATSRGGEIARCALVAKSEKTPLELLIGTVVTERIIDFLMLVVFCLLALCLQFDYISGFFEEFIIENIREKFSPVFVIASVVILFALIFIFLRLRKRSRNKPESEKELSGFKGMVARFAQGLKTVFQIKRPLGFIFLSVFIWCGYWCSTYCVMHSIDATQSLSFLNAISVLIFATIGIAIPLPAGAGVWGAVSIGLQTVYHLPEANAETYGIFTLAFSNLLMIVAGAISYLLYYFEMQRAENDAPRENSKKIWTDAEAESHVRQLKASGKKVVFTNGVFDILHAGHVSYLADAASLGDFLILGLNGDDSVRRLDKSPARPLQSELSRSAVLASLEWVGAVVVFHEDTPAELIARLLPDVLVKGADYQIADIAGADTVLAHGGIVKTIPLLPGFSTTAIERKILSENR